MTEQKQAFFVENALPTESIEEKTPERQEERTPFRTFFARIRKGGLQNAVVSLDQLGPPLFKVFLWVGLSMLIFFIFYTTQFQELSEVDSFDYAQIARHIYRGEGFVTDFIRPANLLFNGNPLSRQPDLSNPPLWSFTLGSFFRLIEPSDRAVALGSGLFYLLSIPLFYLLAKSMFNRRIAFLALVFYITNPVLLRFSISGLPQALLTFLFLLLVYILRIIDEKSLPKTILLGLLMGLMYLTQYSAVLLLVPITGYICFTFKKGQRLRHTLIFLVSFLLVIFPWLLRNIKITANPFFSLAWHKPAALWFLSGNVLYRSMELSLFDIAFRWTTWIKVALFGIRGYYSQLLSLGNTFLIPFFFVAILYRFSDKGLQRFRYTFYVMLFLPMLILSTGNPGVRGLVHFLPLVIIIATAFFIYVLDRTIKSNIVKKVLIGLFVLVNVFPLLLTFVQRSPSRNSYNKENLYQLQKMAGEDETVVSDIPWAVAWYTERPSLWLPWDLKQYWKIDNTREHIKLAYLTPALLNYGRAENTGVWRRIYLTGQLPKEFPLNKGLILRGRELVLADDTGRWQKMLPPEKEVIKEEKKEGEKQEPEETEEKEE